MGNYNDCCVVSVAFREPYVTHSNRQYETIKKDMPDLDIIRFINVLPYAEGIVKENIVERFQKSLYGFKPHAIQQAINKGYKRIIWLDPSVLPTCSMKVLFDNLDSYYVLVRRGEHPILQMCNQKTKDYFEVTKDNSYVLEHAHKHLAGTVYGFNMNDSDSKEVFELWKRSEEEGIFGTQQDFMEGNWADEACLALSMYKVDVRGFWIDDFTFLNQKDL